MTLRIGLDIGSTTVKAVVLNVQMDSVLSVLYRRHHARQKETAVSLLRELQEQFGDTKFSFAVCGSGGKPAAEALQMRRLQETVQAGTRGFYFYLRLCKSYVTLH